MSQAVVRCVDALTEWVKSQSLSSPINQAELQKLDVDLYAACHQAGLEIPTIPQPSHSQLFGFCHLPYHCGVPGMFVMATPEWWQAMLGLKAIAEQAGEAATESAEVTADYWRELADYCGQIEGAIHNLAALSMEEGTPDEDMAESYRKELQKAWDRAWYGGGTRNPPPRNPPINGKADALHALAELRAWAERQLKRPAKNEAHVPTTDTPSRPLRTFGELFQEVFQQANNPTVPRAFTCPLLSSISHYAHVLKFQETPGRFDRWAAQAIANWLEAEHGLSWDAVRALTLERLIEMLKAKVAGETGTGQAAKTPNPRSKPGKKPLNDDDIRNYKALIADWQQFRDGNRGKKKDFCKDRDIKTSDLNKALAWERVNKNRAKT
jgi:hypothetical protein